MTVLDDSARWRKLEQIVTNGQEVTISDWEPIEISIYGAGMTIETTKGRTVAEAFDRAYPLWEEEARKGKRKL